MEWPGVVRAKGFFWISSRPDYVGEVSQAGAFVRHQGIGRWWAAVPDEKWPKDLAFKNNLNKIWKKEYGDRRQEIVFIGLKNQMSQSAIENQLDQYLIKDYLKEPERYELLNDPFPKWEFE